TRLLEQTKENISRRVDVEYREAANREDMLRQAVTEQKREFDSLNSRSFQYQALKREAEGDKKLYDELVRRIKEAAINSSFQNSSIRIADLARPPLRPVYPSLYLNLLVALAASLALGCGAAILSDMLDNTIRDPEQVMRTLSAVVLGSLPIVKNWRGRIASPTAGAELVRAGAAAEQDTNSYDEAIRTLRNSILLTDFDILTAGPVSRRSCESLEKRLLPLLEEASLTYDLVILDAPPMLGFAEPLHMATAVDGVVVVGRAGRTSRKSVGSVLSVLGRL